MTGYWLEENGNTPCIT